MILDNEVSHSDVVICSIWIGPPTDWQIYCQNNHKEYAKLHRYSYQCFGGADQPILAPPHLKSASPAFQTGWLMPIAILELLKTHKFVFWMDMDSLFTNFDISLQDLTNLRKDLVFTGDHNDICNGGHLLFQRTQWSESFLKSWSQLSTIEPNDIQTTHIECGVIGCQIALCALLSNPTTNQTTISHDFNRVNGFRGNRNRHHKLFRYLFTPVTSANLNRISSLIHPTVRPHVSIVHQRRLNSYPKSCRPMRGASWKLGDPIVHLVADTKIQFLNFEIIKTDIK